MAGFAGILRLNGAALDPTTDPILDAMGSAIAHRGLEKRRVRRQGALGIVLPAEPGPPGRPCETQESELVIAFDGRLPSTGGSGSLREGCTAGSVLAPLYRRHGQGLPERLDGRFALCVWEARRGTLLLARDRLGVRPLFHAVVGAGTSGALLLFGSEVKALLAHPDCPREVDWLAALASQALPRRTMARTSFFRGIENLGAGTLLVADTRHGTLQPRRYWMLELPSEEVYAADQRSDAEIVEGYRAALETAVDDALGPEAKSTGLLLSGGIDSVSLASIAARQVRLPTFTVLGQSTFGNGDAGLAHRAATVLGLPEHPVVFRWHEPMAPDHWRRILWLCESPLCGAQHYYKLQLHRHAREARPDLVCMLNGEGSDEFIGADFRNHGEERDEASFEEYLEDIAFKQRDDLMCAETFGVEAWMGRPVFSREFLAASSGRPLPAHPWHRRMEYMLDACDLEVLWRDDRLAAGCGLVSDAPFLDHRLLEYVAHIPPRAYGSMFLRKRMLREAMRGIVPEPLRTARKIPFFAGVDARYTNRLLYDMLMADDRALVREALGDGAHPVLTPDLVDTILEECALDPQRCAATVLLQLVNLGLLENMARDAAVRPGPASAIPALPAIREWDEARIAALLAGERGEAGPDAVLAFAPKVELVRLDRAQLADAPSYLVVDDQVRYVLEGEETRVWREVLRRIDGKRPLGAILLEVGTDDSCVRKHLEEALDFEVLVVVPAAVGSSSVQAAR
jgi:asparagine synthase (glutamine-hydrolysing)